MSAAIFRICFVVKVPACDCVQNYALVFDDSWRQDTFDVKYETEN